MGLWWKECQNETYQHDADCQTHFEGDPVVVGKDWPLNMALVSKLAWG